MKTDIRMSASLIDFYVCPAKLLRSQIAYDVPLGRVYAWALHAVRHYKRSTQY